MQIWAKFALSQTTVQLLSYGVDCTDFWVRAQFAVLILDGILANMNIILVRHIAIIKQLQVERIITVN